MICPACHKLARKSYGCPGVFVCECTGTIEDIEVLRNKQSIKNLEECSIKIKQIYGKGTLIQEQIDLNDFNNYCKKHFKNPVSTVINSQIHKLKREPEYKLFHCQNNDHNFLIIINDLNLIPDGRCIVHDYSIGNAQRTKKEFEPIKQQLIKQKLLDPLFFAPIPRYAGSWVKQFNDYWTK